MQKHTGGGDGDHDKFSGGDDGDGSYSMKTLKEFEQSEIFAMVDAV